MVKNSGIEAVFKRMQMVAMQEAKNWRQRKLKQIFPIATMSIPVHYDEHQKLWDWPLQAHDAFVKVEEDEDHFEVGLDAKMFTAKEIEVKSIGDLLEIRMEHDAKNDEFGSISRNIMRCYRMPEGADPKTLKSSLDRNGVLHIQAMKKRM